ncbi:thiamine/thiamine pyrophosphate ABC transporter permease ThiP [Rubellimicrobium sp. CFH 75288]|uniref:thiamine/thiamine pyrophosphate ABC transporter permease ThiP n=1 Tax=Rubellimicrobium sp. CFH 75288 TaxID=2697034 RepID=UPI00141295E6|nr:thiamine/thiamine pyrophosphate ABC transporter permease ThiP [Rubellimicrobium sp. CFH 75288]NAZ35634.1 thiamine/thiamine pyrophosphate ABC transporter permease ThiP [Rubellimicrobium sp. CFH 75288]
MRPDWGPSRWPGRLAAGVVGVLALGPLVPLLLAGVGRGLGAADAAALRFTLWQAALSAGASCLLAIPLARALARRRFPGRGLLLTLLGAPFLLPAIVAVLALLALFGRGGLVNAGLAALGLGPFSIYGLHGVVLAHVFLNLPLAARLLLAGWAAIPAERFRLAATLGAPVGPLLEWPMLRRTLPGAFAAIFALCLTSFAVALILGGGPRATTVELAIYQAIRFEADFGGAAALALLQYAVGGAAALAAWRLGRGVSLGGGLGRPVERWDAEGLGARLVDALVIGGAVLFLLAPLGLAAWRGVWALGAMPEAVWGAAGRTLLVALGATGLAVTLAVALGLRGGALAQGAGALPLAASPLVLGTGLLLLVRPHVALADAALPVAALVDGLLATPFALRALAPALAEAEARHGRLAASLGLGGWRRLLLVTLPLARPALGFAAGLSAALSAGSLGAIALFAGEGQATLPLLMARLMGSYRMEAAAGVGLVTVALALGLFALFDLWGRRARA